MHLALRLNLLGGLVFCGGLLAACSAGSGTVAQSLPAITRATSATPTPLAGCPTPSPTPTPIHTAEITLNPSALTFQTVGDAYEQTVTVSEPNYSGTFTINDHNCALAGGGHIVSAASISTTMNDPTFRVFPLNAGSCTIVVTDSAGNTAQLPVTVTIITPVPTPTPTPPF